DVTYPVEDCAPGGGHVQVFVHGRGEAINQGAIRFTRSGARKFLQFADAFVQSREGGPGFIETFHGEIEGPAVMALEQQVANVPSAVAFGDKIANREEVPERLAHLLSFDEQMRDVHPVFYERLARRLDASAFALRDLVFVMRED